MKFKDIHIVVQLSKRKYKKNTAKTYSITLIIVHVSATKYLQTQYLSKVHKKSLYNIVFIFYENVKVDQTNICRGTSSDAGCWCRCFFFPFHNRISKISSNKNVHKRNATCTKTNKRAIGSNRHLCKCLFKKRENSTLLRYYIFLHYIKYLLIGFN